MTELKFTETDFVGEINRLFEKFIKASESLSYEQKNNLIAEIPRNLNESHFKTDKFIEAAIEWKWRRWERTNAELLELWKSIAINAANVNPEPHIVANNAIAEIIKSFHLQN